MGECAHELVTDEAEDPDSSVARSIQSWLVCAAQAVASNECGYKCKARR